MEANKWVLTNALGGGVTTIKAEVGETKLNATVVKSTSFIILNFGLWVLEYQKKDFFKPKEILGFLDIAMANLRNNTSDLTKIANFIPVLKKK